MTSAKLRHPTTIFLVLLCATFVNFSTAGVGGIAFAVVMLIAAIKARLIVLYFMHLDAAPLPWRVAFDALILVSTALILGFHFAQ